MYWSGLGNLLGGKENINKAPHIRWEHNVLKMATFKGLDVLATMEGARDLHRSLSTTWFGASGVSYVLLAIFFARYPHKNAPESNNEVDSFYDCTYRGQGEVDLWMMGEGAHDMHHAKSDLSYAHLQGVRLAVEEKYPHLKLEARSNGDLRKLEAGQKLPVKQTAHSPPPMRFAIDRTESVTGAKKMLGTNPAAAVVQIAHAVLKSALHVCTTSDKGLLRKLHKDMKYSDFKQESDHPFPFATWHKTVFAESTSKDLSINTKFIAEEVRKVAQGVGASMGLMPRDEDIKSSYLDFFVNLADIMVTREQQVAFGKQCAETLNIPIAECDVSRSGLLSRLKEHLESPVDSDFMRDPRIGSGSEKDTLRMMGQMVFGATSKL
jgi:hypothetical protein